jgi:hypothetical protein
MGLNHPRRHDLPSQILVGVVIYAYALSLTMFFGAPPVDRFAGLGRR